MTSTAKAKVPDLGLFKTEVGITCSHSYLKSWLLKNNLRAKVPQDIPGKVYFISARNTLRSEDRSEFTVVDKDEVIILQYNKTKTCASLKMTVGATVAIPIVPKDVSGCEIFYGIMFYSLDDAWEVASKFEQTLPNIPLAKQEALERLEATPLEAGEGYFLSYHSILLGDNCKGLKVVNLKSYYCYENCSYDIQAALIKDATEKVVVSSWKTPAARGSMVPPSQGETTGCLDSTATGAQLNTDQHYDHIGSLANTYGGSSSKKIIDSRGKETVASASASVSATAPKVSFTSPASRRSTRSTSTSASVSKHTSTPESATGSFNTADLNCNYFQLTQAQSGPDDQDEDLVNISGSQDSHSSVSFQSPASAGVIAMSADDGDVNDSLNISFVSNNSVSTRSSRSRHAVDAVTYNTDTMYTVDRKVAGWSTLSGMISDKDLIENLKRNKIAAAASLQRSGDKTQRCDHIDVQHAVAASFPELKKYGWHTCSVSKSDLVTATAYCPPSWRPRPVTECVENLDIFNIEGLYHFVEDNICLTTDLDVQWNIFNENHGWDKVVIDEKSVYYIYLPALEPQHTDDLLQLKQTMTELASIDNSYFNNEFIPDNFGSRSSIDKEYAKHCVKINANLNQNHRGKYKYHIDVSTLVPGIHIFRSEESFLTYISKFPYLLQYPKKTEIFESYLQKHNWKYSTRNRALWQLPEAINIPSLVNPDKIEPVHMQTMTQLVRRMWTNPAIFYSCDDHGLTDADIIDAIRIPTKYALLPSDQFNISLSRLSKCNLSSTSPQQSKKLGSSPSSDATTPQQSSVVSAKRRIVAAKPVQDSSNENHHTNVNPRNKESGVNSNKNGSRHIQPGSTISSMSTTSALPPAPAQATALTTRTTATTTTTATATASNNTAPVYSAAAIAEFYENELNNIFDKFEIDPRCGYIFSEVWDILKHKDVGWKKCATTVKDANGDKPTIYLPSWTLADESRMAKNKYNFDTTGLIENLDYFMNEDTLLWYVYLNGITQRASTPVCNVENSFRNIKRPQRESGLSELTSFLSCFVSDCQALRSSSDINTRMLSDKENRISEDIRSRFDKFIAQPGAIYLFGEVWKVAKNNQWDVFESLSLGNNDLETPKIFVARWVTGLAHRYHLNSSRRMFETRALMKNIDYFESEDEFLKYVYVNGIFNRAAEPVTSTDPLTSTTESALNTSTTTTNKRVRASQTSSSSSISTATRHQVFLDFVTARKQKEEEDLAAARAKLLTLRKREAELLQQRKAALEAANTLKIITKKAVQAETMAKDTPSTPEVEDYLRTPVTEDFMDIPTPESSCAGDGRIDRIKELLREQLACEAEPYIFPQLSRELKLLGWEVYAESNTENTVYGGPWVKSLAIKPRKGYLILDLTQLVENRDYFREKECLQQYCYLYGSEGANRRIGDNEKPMPFMVGGYFKWAQGLEKIRKDELKAVERKKLKKVKVKAVEAVKGNVAAKIGTSTTVARSQPPITRQVETQQSWDDDNTCDLGTRKKGKRVSEHEEIALQPKSTTADNATKILKQYSSGNYVKSQAQLQPNASTKRPKSTRNSATNNNRDDDEETENIDENNIIKVRRSPRKALNGMANKDPSDPYNQYPTYKPSCNDSFDSNISHGSDTQSAGMGGEDSANVTSPDPSEATYNDRDDDLIFMLRDHHPKFEQITKYLCDHKGWSCVNPSKYMDITAKGMGTWAYVVKGKTRTSPNMELNKDYFFDENKIVDFLREKYNIVGFLPLVADINKKVTRRGSVFNAIDVDDDSDNHDSTEIDTRPQKRSRSQSNSSPQPKQSPVSKPIANKAKSNGNARSSKAITAHTTSIVKSTPVAKSKSKKVAVLLDTESPNSENNNKENVPIHVNIATTTVAARPFEETIELVRKRLLPDARPELPQCREPEFDAISKAISEALRRKRGACIYTCGNCGLGKTMVVKQAIARIGGGPSFVNGKEFFYIPIQGTAVDGKHLFYQIAVTLGLFEDGENQLSKAEEKVLEYLRAGTKSGKKTLPMVVVVIDEIDKVRPVSAVAKLLEVTKQGREDNHHPSSLILIGMGNTVNAHDNWGNTVDHQIVFSPYTCEQLVQIMRTRTMGLFAENALDYMSQRALKSFNGDFRQTMQILYECLDIGVKKMQNDPDNVPVPPGEVKVIVDRLIVMKRMNELGYGSSREPAQVNFLTSQSRLMLVAIILNGFDECTYISKLQIHNMYITFLSELHIKTDEVGHNTTDRILEELLNAGVLSGGPSTHISSDRRNSGKRQHLLRVTPMNVLRAASLEDLLRQKLVAYLEAQKLNDNK